MADTINAIVRRAHSGQDIPDETVRKFARSLLSFSARALPSAQVDTYHELLELPTSRHLQRLDRWFLVG
jgi:hypothetical protein